ncbi:MAG: hypothetical protein CME06_14340 [Gemmatimonadetes bacterium]|nr:hypothetical protein [Gemmatimonadota bacterium]
MPTTTVLVLVPGLSSNHVSQLAASGTTDAMAQGTVAPEPHLSQAAARAVLLKGVTREGERAIAPDLFSIVEETEGGDAACLCVHTAGDIVEELSAQISTDARLIVVDWEEPHDAEWGEIAAALPEANLVVVGYGGGGEASAFLAAGPDIYSGARVDATLVDLHPTVLSLLRIVPPPGPMTEGRALHEICSDTYLNDDEQAEVIEHLRAVGYVE